MQNVIERSPRDETRAKAVRHDALELLCTV